ncbi:MAG: D-alanyl-D-alanine carboxypeptidase [Nocardioides sp.]
MWRRPAGRRPAVRRQRAVAPGPTGAGDPACGAPAGDRPGHPGLRPVLTGLPVAGFTGSLSYRFEELPPRPGGGVRAKTGTLTGVHGLAGVAVDRRGTPLLFVLVADRVRKADTLAARSAAGPAGRAARRLRARRRPPRAEALAACRHGRPRRHSD